MVLPGIGQEFPPTLELVTRDRTDEGKIMHNSARPGPAILGFPSGRDHRPAWRTVNITPAERLGRIAAGLAAVIAGAALLTSAGSALAAVLEALLVAAGLDLAVTGGLGHCPLYARLGYLPKSLRSPR
jgi:hypothetical protein